jgi:hypothetical protein
MKKETMMNPTIEKLRVRQILDTLASLTSDSIDRIIAAAQVELRERDAEELFKEAFDDMLHGRTNALEGIK